MPGKCRSGESMDMCEGMVEYRHVCKGMVEYRHVCEGMVEYRHGKGYVSALQRI